MLFDNTQGHQQDLISQSTGGNQELGAILLSRNLSI
jgi:hypothetical protein